MSLVVNGSWSEQRVSDYLRESVYPVRLACIAADGFPRVVSVWYGFYGGKIHCVSHRSSKLISMLENSDKVGFEVATNEPPYCGVRGQGIARLAHDANGEVLRRMLQRYLGGSESSLGQWLLSRAEDEMLIEIEPLRIFSWDYRERMQDSC